MLTLRSAREVRSFPPICTPFPIPLDLFAQLLALAIVSLSCSWENDKGYWMPSSGSMVKWCFPPFLKQILMLRSSHKMFPCNTVQSPVLPPSMTSVS